MSYILKTNKLTKIIAGKEIVSNVDVNVKKGEIYGFLGPNGAGKTSIMKMMANLWKPTTGDIEIFGQKMMPDSNEFLKRMGIIIEFPVFYNELSGKENLEMHCAYMGYHSPDCVENALKMLQLADTGNLPVKSYSLGMRQRLGIARAIITKPEILLLDEPANGLDPAGMKQIRELLKIFCREYGMTILISSHILSEIENLADTIGVINHGKMIKEVALSTVKDMNFSYIELVTPDRNRAAYVLTENLHIQNFKLNNENEIRIYENEVSMMELSKALALNDVPIEALTKKSDSLEDYFLKMTAEGK